MRQILDHTGELVDVSPDLTDDDLIAMFRTLLSTRIVDEKLLNLQRQGRMPAYYQVSGQEAHIGAALALRETDWIFTAYRELGLWIARDMPLKTAVGFWLGIPDDDDIWDVQKYRITRLNATIGTHLPHAVGFGYAHQLRNEDTVSMVVFGDGATSESDFHAAMNFAGVWKTPTIFLCQNNQVAQSTTLDKQTAAETLAHKAQAYGFPGVRVDGMDPMAMYQVTKEAVARAAAGDGPTFIEMHTYRYAPHSTYDGTPVYRTDEEEAEWRTKDPIIRMRTFLENKGLWEAAQEDILREQLSAELENAVNDLEARPGVDREYSPRQLFHQMPKMLANQLRREQEDMGEAPTEFSDDELWQVGAEPVPTGDTKRVDLTTALNMALTDAFERDDTLIALGEDVGLEGGVFRITEGMYDKFGEDRIIDTPLCETGIVGTAVGMAMAGMRPVAEMEFAGFVYPAFDQVIGHMGRIRWRYRGHMTAPIVLRLPVGTGLGNYEFHTDSPESYFVHSPGLVVVYPSTPYDAKGLMETSLASPDPVIFMEPIPLYRGLKEEVPVEPYSIPFGRAAIRREGTDVTIVSWGPPVHTALEAATSLEAEGVSAEVIDLRTLYPWDVETVLASVEKTGRIVIAHEAHKSNGFGAEIAATIAEEGAYFLETPPVRIAHMDVFWGPTQLESYSMITADRIAAGIRRAMKG
ncbi:MAG: pyruvate dehydrogenase (acetyl-transferring) E1 component subunit alpha [Acidimicrobiales bacterium]|nr:pyruvate dehydrogenase (acetyl-transferring) E1 component subunit alpha [Acidimicrobiales bacterium]RZV47222.1 MAG: pyruvate dehydrogenase (acetyl-transferring) E1 component subunit alpha [Acidimicrobiales bacterium]